jgi:preprotein translocase SecE subunit
MLLLPKLIDYFAGVKKEFKHIKFISRKEVYQISMLVIVAVFIFAFCFSMLDLIIRNLIRVIIGL